MAYVHRAFLCRSRDGANYISLFKMSELGDSFRDYREYMREKKSIQRGVNTENLRWICEKLTREHSWDFDYTEITEYQWRLTWRSKKDIGNAKIDIYPTSSRYHNVATGKRGYVKITKENIENLLKQSR